VAPPGGGGRRRRFYAGEALWEAVVITRQTCETVYPGRFVLLNDALSGQFTIEITRALKRNTLTNQTHQLVSENSTFALYQVLSIAEFRVDICLTSVFPSPFP
jgi:hypothetical protein